MEYIAVCIVEGSYQTRSMLVPYELFIKKYPNEYSLLNMIQVSDVIKSNKFVEEITNKLMFYFKTFCRIRDRHYKIYPITDETERNIINDWLEVVVESDRCWAKYCVIDIVSGFNHDDNFKYVQNLPNIVKSFLIYT